MPNAASPEEVGLSSAGLAGILAGGLGAGRQAIRPGFGFVYGFSGAVFTDPEHDLLYVGLIQRMGPGARPPQAIIQAAIADAIPPS